MPAPSSSNTLIGVEPIPIGRSRPDWRDGRRNLRAGCFAVVRHRLGLPRWSRVKHDPLGDFHAEAIAALLLDPQLKRRRSRKRPDRTLHVKRDPRAVFKPHAPHPAQRRPASDRIAQRRPCCAPLRVGEDMNKGWGNCRLPNLHRSDGGFRGATGAERRKARNLPQRDGCKRGRIRRWPRQGAGLARIVGVAREVTSVLRCDLHANRRGRRRDQAEFALAQANICWQLVVGRHQHTHQHMSANLNPRGEALLEGRSHRAQEVALRARACCCQRKYRK